MTLLSLLSVGMLFALRLGLTRSPEDRCQADGQPPGGGGAAHPGAGAAGPDAGADDVPGRGWGGELLSGRAASRCGWSRSFRWMQAWRGQPQVLELFVIPGENGEGVRLVVNEIPLQRAGPAWSRTRTGSGRVGRVRTRSCWRTSWPIAGSRTWIRRPTPADPGIWVPAWDASRVAVRHQGGNGADGSEPVAAATGHGHGTGVHVPEGGAVCGLGGGCGERAFSSPLQTSGRGERGAVRC